MQKELLIKSKINKNNLVICVPVIESQKISNSFKSLHRYLKDNGFKGYEFDDILGSKVVKLLTIRKLFLERVAIQVGRRSIINLWEIGTATIIGLGA